MRTIPIHTTHADISLFIQPRSHNHGTTRSIRAYSVLELATMLHEGLASLVTSGGKLVSIRTKSAIIVIDRQFLCNMEATQGEVAPHTVVFSSAQRTSFNGLVVFNSYISVLFTAIAIFAYFVLRELILTAL